MGCVADHAHIFRERALDAVQRANFFAGLRAAHGDSVLVQFIEIECMRGVAKLEHHVVGDIHHVVDRVLADCSKALAKPIRRWLNFDAAHNARREAAAQIGRFDSHPHGIRGLFRGLLQLRLNRLHRQPVNGRHFARHPIVAEAIGAV